jgi:hypothetical protein
MKPFLKPRYIYENSAKNQEMDQNYNAPWPQGMSTLVEVMDLADSRGFHAEFSVGPKGLSAAGTEIYFSPVQVRIHNFYRFEGSSNPDDMSILYLIETSDGLKGTLVDAYGTYSDSMIDEFIWGVEDITKLEPGGG